MSYVFHRHNHVDYPVAAKGDGVYVIDRDGKRYLDACGGAAVSCLGHSHPVVRRAMHEQIDTLAYAHTGFFTTEIMEELAEFLITRAPEGIERAYLVSGGSEAVEAAIKLAKQYYIEKGEPNRRYVISRWQSYHGNTLGALSAGGNRWRRQQYESLLIEMKHIMPCYEYRHKEEDETSYAFGQRAAQELEDKIQELGAENVMAFFAEPVVGATMGCVPAVEGYFKTIREICDRHGVLLILDEVMCGMGRTGTLFASEQEGIAPDIVTIAKSMGGGYQPIGATLVAGKIYDAITNGSGFFQHGHTYLGHATACAASLAVLKHIESENLLGKVQRDGVTFESMLRKRYEEHPYVGNIRGRGLFWGLEFVKDKVTKEHFDPAEKIHAKIKSTAMDEGLMCYPMGGTIDGKTGDHVMFAPPYVFETQHFNELLERFDRVLARTLS